jgi:hypothetical protein
LAGYDFYSSLESKNNRDWHIWNYVLRYIVNIDTDY